MLWWLQKGFDFFSLSLSLLHLIFDYTPVYACLIPHYLLQRWRSFFATNNDDTHCRCFILFFVSDISLYVKLDYQKKIQPFHHNADANYRIYYINSLNKWNTFTVLSEDISLYKHSVEKKLWTLCCSFG